MAPTSWSREPTLHFIVIGVVMTLAFQVLEDPDRSINIPNAALERRQSELQDLNQRPLTAAEKQSVRRDVAKEEVFVRKARDLGLDEHDVIIRRRLIQRMEFLLEDTVEFAPPTDVEIRTYFEAHQDAFRSLETFDLEHIFIRRSADGEDHTRAERIGIALREGRAPETLGDPFPRGRSFSRRPALWYREAFGSSFSEALANTKNLEWVGPLGSAYGLHWVRISERTETATQSLEDVRDEIERRLASESREEAMEATVEGWMEEYDVVYRP
jgi:hypothetical protein